MIAKLRNAWQDMRSSFWFVPAVIVLGAVALATALIALDVTFTMDFVERWPLFFGAGAAGSRGLLTAVASSMITVAGVVFSITIVALALTSSQYTSRVLRNFMRDRINQTVLGVFVGIFAYCLVVLRTIRAGDEGAFVPAIAVMGGLILAFVGIAYLIYFIHHIAMSIQASSIIAAAARETIAAVDHLFPKKLSNDGDEDADLASTFAEQNWTAVPARKTGYIESIDRNIAMKALSPGINDTTTAVMCVDYLAAILVRLAPLQIATLHGLDQGKLRVIARGPTFESLLAEALDQIRQNAAGNVAVLTRLLQALETIVGQTANAGRRQALRQQADLVTAVAERTITSPHDLAGIQASMPRVFQVLGEHCRGSAASMERKPGNA